MKEKLSAEGVTTIQLLEDVTKLVVDAAKLILKDKEGIKETAKLILKEALKEAAIVIVKESVELAVKEEAKLILKALEKQIDHYPTTDSSQEGINHWINKFIWWSLYLALSLRLQVHPGIDQLTRKEHNIINFVSSTWTVHVFFFLFLWYLMVTSINHFFLSLTSLSNLYLQSIIYRNSASLIYPQKA